MEYQKPKIKKGSAKKHHPLRQVPSLFEDEPTQSINYRTDLFWQVMKIIDDASQNHFKGVIETFQGNIEETLFKICQLPHNLSSSKWLDFPRIMYVNGTTIKADLNFGKLLPKDALIVNCSPATAFSDVIRNLCAILSIPQTTEFDESFIELIKGSLEMRDMLVLAFHNSDHLPAKTLKTLLDYFKMANQDGKIVFACDGLSCVDRLDARTKYSLYLEHVSAPSPSDLLINLIIFLTKHLADKMVLSGEVVHRLRERCRDGGLPLFNQIQVLKYCLYAHLSQNLFSYLPNLDHFNGTSKENLKKMLKWQYPTFHQLYSDSSHPDYSSDPIVLANASTTSLPELLGTNIIGFSILRVIFDFVSWEGKSNAEVYHLMLEPNFGHHIFFDMIPTKIQSFIKGKLDVYAQLLQRLVFTLEALNINNGLSQRLHEQIQSDVQAIKRPADMGKSIEGIITELRNATYFNHKILGAEQVLFSDHQLISRSLFPDTLQSIQKVFKMRPQGLSSIHASCPDTCIVYSLTLDWQRIINTKDLYHQFLGIVEQQPPRKTRKRKAMDDSQQKLLMLRFMQALNELELLGLLASSGRKRDHYERLNLSDASAESTCE